MPTLGAFALSGLFVRPAAALKPYAALKPALAVGVVEQGPAAGLKMDATVGGQWLPQIRFEAGTWVHGAEMDALDETDEYAWAPVALLAVEPSYLFPIGSNWRVGPALASERSYATDRENSCSGEGGCLYPGWSAALGVTVGRGAFAAEEPRFDGHLGVETFCHYDSCVPVFPRLRADWRTPSGLAVGAEVVGRANILVQVGYDVAWARD